MLLLLLDTQFDPHIRLCKEGMYNARTGMSRQATQGESSVHDTNVVQLKKKKKQSKIGTEEAKIPYRDLIGCLLWISMGTRPDVSYALNQCARYSSDPKTRTLDSLSQNIKMSQRNIRSWIILS